MEHPPDLAAIPYWIAATAIVLTVIFGDLPGEGRYVAVLQNSCHAPAFAVLSLITLRLLPRNPPITKAWQVPGAMLLVAIGTEGVQALLGRDAELQDVVSDLVGSLGVISGWLFLRWRGTSDSNTRLGRFACLTLCAAAVGYWLYPPVTCALAYWHRYREFPVLAEFRSPRDLYFIDSSGTKTRIVTLGPGRDSAKALEAILDTGPWPGFTLHELMPDWRGYDALNVDISNPGSIDLPLRLRVNDHAHDGNIDDRFNTEFRLPPKARMTVRIRLDEIEYSPRLRKMNMSRVSQLILFRAGGAPGQVIRLHRVWLE